MAHHMDMIDVVLISLGGVLATFLAAAIIGFLADYVMESRDDR